MKKIEMYQAFDGVLFDSAAECLDYEMPIMYARQDLVSYVTFKDKDGNEIELPDERDSNYDEIFEKAFWQADICIINDDLPEKAISYLDETIGLYIPVKKGIYRYDWKVHEWISYKKNIDEFLTNWHITFDELVKMGN